MSDFVRTSIRISRNRIQITKNGFDNQKDNVFDFDIDVMAYDGDNNVVSNHNGTSNNRVVKTTLNFNLTKPEKMKNATPLADVDENQNNVGRRSPYIRNNSACEMSVEHREKKLHNDDDDAMRTSNSMDNLLYENGQLYNKLAECDRDYITRSDRNLPNNKYRPKKPQRSVKYDRERNTFVPWPSAESVGSISEKLPVMKKDSLNNFILPEEDLDAFIRREKVNYSGQVVKDSQEFLSETQKLDSFPIELTIGCKNVRDSIEDDYSSVSSYPVIDSHTEHSPENKLSDAGSSHPTIDTEEGQPSPDVDRSSGESQNLSLDSRRFSLESCPQALKEIRSREYVSGQQGGWHSHPVSEPGNIYQHKQLPSPPSEDKISLSDRLGRLRRSIRNAMTTGQKSSSQPIIPRRSSSLRPAPSREKLYEGGGLLYRGNDRVTELSECHGRLSEPDIRKARDREKQPTISDHDSSAMRYKLSLGNIRYNNGYVSHKSNGQIPDGVGEGDAVPLSLGHLSRSNEIVAGVGKSTGSGKLHNISDGGLIARTAENVRKESKEADREPGRQTNTKMELLMNEQSDNRTSKMLALECEREERLLQVERANIAEERLRLTDLHRHLSERSELEELKRQREFDLQKVKEHEIAAKRVELSYLEKEQKEIVEEQSDKLRKETEQVKRREEMLKQREKELEELHAERRRREELEQLLEKKKIEQDILDYSLSLEKEKRTVMEKNLAEERAKRLDIEKRLLVEEARNRTNEKKCSSSSESKGGNNDPFQNRRASPLNSSLRSSHSYGNLVDELNLQHHISSLGHDIERCPDVRIDKSSCRGFLQKMSKSKLKPTWTKQWFVFDRKMRVFCYYQDENRKKPNGILYFQSIQEVYVEGGLKRSPNIHTTFCVRTPTKLYAFSASSPIAMSIWIDVLCTGKEGATISTLPRVI